ncbi:hypothetical protein LguiB_031722 [Lonicera macranthoides]
MEYMPNPLEGNHRHSREAFLKEYGEFSNEGPIVEDKIVTLEPHQFQQIRRWVLFRLDVDGVNEYYSEYEASLKFTSHGKIKGSKMTEVDKQTSFLPLLYDKVVFFSIDVVVFITSDYGKCISRATHFFHASSQPSGDKDVKGKLKINVESDGFVGEFAFNVSPKLARPLLEKAWSQKFRTFKRTLRDYLKENGPVAVGPKGQEKKPQKKFRRVDRWYAGHEREDGSVLDCAKEAYDQLKTIYKGNNMNREGDNYAYEDIDNDELSNFFGKDPKGRVRAIGSNVSKKQLIHLGIATKKFEQLKKANEEEDTMKNELFSRFDSRLNNFEDILNVLLHQKNKESALAMMHTATSDHRIISDHLHPNLAQNMENICAAVGASQSSHPMNTHVDKPQVIVCDKFGKHLAKGYLVTDETAGTCYFKKVAKEEKKVYIDEVFDPDARLWDAPQGGHDTLAGYVDGGFLIWLGCWLNYV